MSGSVISTGHKEMSQISPLLSRNLVIKVEREAIKTLCANKYHDRKNQDYPRDQQTFSVKGQTVNNLGFMNHIASVTTTSLYHREQK